MNKEQYLRMCEQTGEEIDWDRCPPEIDDFPPLVHTSVEIFNSLGDRVYPDVGFVGKDFTNLELLYRFHKVPDYNKEYVLELCLQMENITRKESQAQIKAAYDKIKKK
jgi:hypothetical protein